MKNWELRREVMGWEVDEAIKFGMVLCIDHFDWNTMNRVFQTENAYNQWLYGLAKRYNTAGGSLKLAMRLLKRAGVVTVTEVGELRVMTLGAPTNKDEAIEFWNELWNSTVNEGEAGDG